MLGESEVIAHLAKGQKFQSIFVMVGCHGDFDPNEQGFIRKDEYLLPGEVYKTKFVGSATIVTGKRRPKVDALPYLKGQKVIMVHSDGSDSLFAAWFSVVVDSEPEFTVALDSENEIYAN